MKIAFTSCCDPGRDHEQVAWNVLARQQPDVVVLLGDCIYMDYGLGDHVDNGDAIKLPLDEFSRRMHAFYAKQFAVPSFQSALRNRRVYAVWDDHDFGCNNGRGADPGGPSDDDSIFVPAEYRIRARALFGQFRSVISSPPARYPFLPFPLGVTPPDLGGVQQVVDLAPSTRLHLLDGRTFRPVPDKRRSLLGPVQQAALQAALVREPGINILASGTTLKDWKEFADYDWLRAISRTHRILVLSGDVHEPDFRSYGRVFEATASAMAQTPSVTRWVGKKTEVFGILDVRDDELEIGLWHRGRMKEKHVIDRATWTSDE